MTKNSNSVDAPTFQAWAAEKLQATAASDFESLRRSFLRVLDEEELVPYDYQLEAFLGVQQLARDTRSIPAPESYKNELREQVLEQVKAFARDFSELSVQQRREKFNELSSQCRPFIPVWHRLLRLQPLLDYDEQALAGESSCVKELARWLVDCAGRSPFQQGILKQELRERVAQDVKAWSQAARRLRRVLPRVAAVDKALVSQLQKGGLNPASELPRPLPRQRPATEAMGRSTRSHWAAQFGWGLLFVFIIAIAFSGVLDSNKPRNQPYFPAGPKPDSYPLKDWGIRNGYLSPDGLKLSDDLRRKLDKALEGKGTKKSSTNESSAEDTPPDPDKRK